MLNFLKRKQVSNSPTNPPTELECPIKQIGNVAGQVWQTLNQSGETPINQLVKQVGISRDEVMLAIGWLARENKINLAGQGNSLSVALYSDDCQSRAA